jgi:UPF0042 nucleotide-binding protein
MNLSIIIITGLSGSGKSTAIDAFEDAGFYCVDNMPVALLPKFLDLPIENDTEIAGLAFVMDLREKDFLPKHSSVFKSIEKSGNSFKVIFLEADNDILLQRYSQTRRQHPLSQGKNLAEGIRIEREKLQPLRANADTIINTSHYNVHQLKTVILDIAQKNIKLTQMRIDILSFGFKYGIPHNSDHIMDVRFLANPFFINKLKDLDGQDDEVKKFILESENAHIFLQKYLNFLDYLVPLYEKERKAYLTIAVGCTGGRHRSVTIAHVIFEHIRNQGKLVEIIHRDINR